MEKRVGLGISRQAVQLLAAAFELPARGPVCGRGYRSLFLRLAGLPDCRGNDCGIGNSASPLIIVPKRCSGTRTAEQFVQPFGVDFAAKKIRFFKNTAEKTGMGHDAGAEELLEGAAKGGGVVCAA